MSESPYRKPYQTEEPSADRLIYPTPRKPSAVVNGFLFIVAIPVGFASMAMFAEPLFGGLAAVAFVAVVRLFRSLRLAGTELEIVGGALILREEWKTKRVSVPLADLAEVKVETAEVSALDTGWRPGPGFGMPEGNGEVVAFESRIALLLNGRSEPLYLRVPRSRQSMTETFEEQQRIVRFLSSRGWIPRMPLLVDPDERNPAARSLAELHR